MLTTEVNAKVYKSIDVRFSSSTFPPYKALICTDPDADEFCGKFYKIRFFPLEFGAEKDGCHGSYVMGYALHEDSQSFSQLVIGCVPSMECWSNVFDSSHGFLVTFQYAGYSEIYKKVYGFYVKHEIIPDDTDQCA